MDKLTLSAVLPIPGVITALILMPAGHLADRVGRKPPVVAGLALLTVCHPAARMATNPLIVAADATVPGLRYALPVTVWNALAMDRIPREVGACFPGAVSTVQRAGVPAGPIAGGFLRDQVHHLGRSNPPRARHGSITAHQSQFAF